MATSKRSTRCLLRRARSESWPTSVDKSLMNPFVYNDGEGSR